MSDFFSWETLWGVGLAILAIGLAWGMFRYYTRNRSNDRVTEKATRLMREHSTERYMKEDRPALERAVKSRPR